MSDYKSFNEWANFEQESVNHCFQNKIKRYILSFFCSDIQVKNEFYLPKIINTKCTYVSEVPCSVEYVSVISHHLIAPSSRVLRAHPSSHH